MQMDFDLLAELKNMLPQLSRGQRAVARYIISNYDKASYMTAEKLGECVGVSESTIVRFAIKAGYKGYPQLQEELGRYVRNRLKKNRKIEFALEDMETDEIIDFIIANDVKNLTNAGKCIDKNLVYQAMETVFDAHKIYIIGFRSCMALALLLYNNLKVFFENVVLVNNSSMTQMFEELMYLNERDTVIGISFPRYSMQTIKALEFANNRNAKIISITDGVNSPLNLYSSCNLIAPSNMSSVVESYTAAVSIINILTTAVYMKDRTRILGYVEKLDIMCKEYGKIENEELNLLDYDNIREFKQENK